MNKVLAIDMGATSIRGIIGFVEMAFYKLKRLCVYLMKLLNKREDVIGNGYRSKNVETINEQSGLTSM